MKVLPDFVLQASSTVEGVGAEMWEGRFGASWANRSKVEATLKKGGQTRGPPPKFLPAARALTPPPAQNRGANVVHLLQMDDVYPPVLARVEFQGAPISSFWSHRLGRSGPESGLSLIHI